MFGIPALRILGPIMAGFLISAALVVGGYHTGKKIERAHQLEKRMEAKERADEIEDDVDELDDDGLLDGLLSR